MKKFEQPVVALNEMTMSESIASICCYAKSEIGDAWGTLQTNVTVLNGGSISAKSDGTKRYFVHENVLAALGGIVPAPSVHYTLRTGVTVSYVNQDAINSGATIGDAKISYTDYPLVRFTYGLTDFTFGDVKVKRLDSAYYWDADKKTVTEWKVFDNSYAFPTNNQICSHTTSSCPWITSETVGSSDGGMHTGSTVAHSLGGQKWWLDHVPQQYAS
ncbi:MAG: hypothetical protein LBS11_02710 [Oscillospiraceae bacterium]|nr:hypothetical protein [Oscillospiraceae bacterium]